MGMNLGDLNKVWEIRALKRKDRQEEARGILERVAKQVQPIMRKHNWRVKLLSEFCPNNSRLLGLNVGGGVHVKLRLRRPNRDLDFFPFDQILDTMLHELCHNAHGPHNANFYKLWDEIRKECEELMAKGITGTGEGFDLSGRRLGGFSRQPPLSSLRKTTLVAAEKRARLGSLLPSGPKRLGGDNSIMAALSPVQAAAMAAERRLQDDIWCGSQSCEASGDGESSSNLSEDIVGPGQSAESSKQHNGSAVPTLDPFSRKRSRESDKSLLFQSSKGPSESSFVDSSMGSSTSRSILEHDMSSQKRSHGPDSNSFSESFNCHRVSNLVGLSSAPSSESMLDHDAIKNPEEAITWECVTCTLLNPPLAPICKLCSTEKPKDGCTKFKIWSCKFCTLENNVELERCSACGQWRYSHGPPVSTSAPYLGT